MRLSRFAPIAIVAVMLASVSQAEAQAPPSITITESDSVGLIVSVSGLPFTVPNITTESVTISGFVPLAESFSSGLSLTDAGGISDVLTVNNNANGLTITFTSDAESPLPTNTFLALPESSCLPSGCQFHVDLPSASPGGGTALSFDVFVTSDADATVPEPATLILVGAGILASAGFRLRRRRRS